MAALSPLSASATVDDRSFVPPPSIRQPPDLIGPRARRTIARITDAARDVFLTRGYAGTTIDEIARVARVSRASVYTYFPSKREVLYAIGARGAAETNDIIESLRRRPRTRVAMAGFVSDYFDYLDDNGSFSSTWSQAAQVDEKIRVAGMKRHLTMCRTFGTVLAESAGRAVDRPELLGLACWSLIERSWGYAHLYHDTVARSDVIDEVARALWATARSKR